MIQVTGTLVTPLNQAAVGAVIRVTALENEEDTTSGTLLGSTGSITVGDDGSYDFSLVNGKHEIEVHYSDEYILTGEAVISSGTESPITLPVLLDL